MSAPRRIPLCKPSFTSAESTAAANAVKNGDVVGHGPIGAAAEAKLAGDIGAKRVLLTTSGSHALELAAAVMGFGPGDEVIVPAFTFSSVANCILRQKAVPVFADVLKGTLNLDPADVARRITRRTKAILPVHYAGVASDMAALGSLAKSRGLPLLEDAAHCVGATYRGKALGTIGKAGCFSFHSTKNITCGEGGAFMTDDLALAEKAEIFREKGTNRSAFMRGQVKKYTWVSEGSSYVLSDVLAAVLMEQWKKLPAINAKRRRIYESYVDGLRAEAASGKVFLPTIPEDCVSSYHLFHVLMPSVKMRDRCLDALRARGVGATFHYQSLHNSPFGRKALACRERMPVSEMASGCLLRLPLYPDLSRDDAAFVLDEFKKILARF